MYYVHMRIVTPTRDREQDTGIFVFETLHFSEDEQFSLIVIVFRYAFKKFAGKAPRPDLYRFPRHILRTWARSPQDQISHSNLEDMNREVLQEQMCPIQTLRLK